MSICYYHGRHKFPVCERCRREGRRFKKRETPRITESLVGQVKRVEKVCPYTGKKKISFEIA
jgi:hypothetical protein